MHVLQKRLVSHMLQDSMYFLCDENFPYFLGEMGKMIGSLADVWEFSFLVVHCVAAQL